MSMTDPTGAPPTEEPDHIKQLRADAQRAHAADAALAESNRKIAFLEAGVNTGTALGKMVMQEHGDAEITPDAVKATVLKVRTDLGLPPDETPPPTPPPDPSTQPGTPEHQLLEMQGGQGGAPAPIVPPPAKSGRERAMDEFYAAKARGETEQDAREIGISALIKSAQEGDAATRFNQAQRDELNAQHGHGGEWDHIDRTESLPKVELGPNSLQKARQARLDQVAARMMDAGTP